MRLAMLALLLPLAACATPPEAVQTAALDADPKKPEPARVCWTEKVTGTLGRKQTVCRDERSEDNADMMRRDLKAFQDRASGTQGQTLPTGAGS